MRTECQSERLVPPSQISVILTSNRRITRNFSPHFLALISSVSHKKQLQVPDLPVTFRISLYIRTLMSTIELSGTGSSRPSRTE